MIFDRYIFRDLAIAMVFTAITLASVILLTQSLRFLELVIDAGASTATFWFLTLLALPRFFEIILPIAGMAATVFVYNRMTMDSELVVMRATGSSPLSLARPALVLSLLTAGILLVITTWLAPISLSNMQQLRQVIKAQYSSLLFREGVFNSVGNGLTVFVRHRASSGELLGLMIHDSREQNESPVTVLARRGALTSSRSGQQVVVYEGTRQAINPKTGALNRLDFDRYTIDLPDGAGPVRQRWREPEERTLPELLNPDRGDERDLKNKRDFMVEIHRRMISPLLAPTFVLMSLALLLVGPVDRRGQGWRIAGAVSGAILIEALYLTAFNLSRDKDLGIILMYALVVLPSALSLFFLTAGPRSGNRASLAGGSAA